MVWSSPSTVVYGCRSPRGNRSISSRTVSGPRSQSTRSTANCRSVIAIDFFPAIVGPSPRYHLVIRTDYCVGWGEGSSADSWILSKGLSIVSGEARSKRVGACWRSTTEQLPDIEAIQTLGERFVDDALTGRLVFPKVNSTSNAFSQHRLHLRRVRGCCSQARLGSLEPTCLA